MAKQWQWDRCTGVGRAKRRRRLAILASGVVLAVGPTGPTLSRAQQPASVEQGWSSAERIWWSEVSQGSRLIPLAFLAALEQPDTTELFLHASHIARFGYLPPPRTAAGRPVLPLGFPVDKTADDGMSITRLRWRESQKSDEPWVGMNCAACHSAQITFKGRTLQVMGAPANADFQGFLEAMDRALQQTLADAARFARFANRVLGAGHSQVSRSMLATSLESLIAWRRTLEDQGATALRYGPARLDAVGHIMNKVAVVVGGGKTEPWPADAPVSYPFVWNAPQHDRVQWNGIANNDPSPVRVRGQPTDFGALGRNVGEVIGVFADVTVDSFALNGFGSSVQVRNLIEIERLLGKLRSPAWPTDIFGPLDRAKVSRGSQVYVEKGCHHCHKPLDRTDLTSRVKAEMSSLSEAGTDIWMACNSWSYSNASGILTGTKANILKGEVLGDKESGAKLLTAMVTGVLIGKADDIVQSFARDLFSPPSSIFAAGAPRDRLQPAAGFPDDERKRRLATNCLGAEDALLAYKARPLNGIWATAPYLHNGSVPTLYDLLLPSDLRPLTVSPSIPLPAGPYRPSSFFVGTREFDPVRVGFKVDAEASDNRFAFNTRTPDGKEILGNSNAGHDYGTRSLSEADRLALVEYLKSL